MTTLRGLPRDDNNQVAQLTFAKAALARTRNISISSSTEITLDSSTQMVEITAVGDNVYMKYGTDNVTNSNFDEFIAAGQTRHYFIPSGTTAINVIDDGNSGTVIVIEK